MFGLATWLGVLPVAAPFPDAVKSLVMQTCHLHQPPAFLAYSL
jgi:hypothetical protein